MSKRIKLAVGILLIIILNFAILINTVQAVQSELVNVYTKGYFKKVLKNNGIVIRVSHAAYQENGQEYLAYCLDRELLGVGAYIESYNVSNQGKLTDLGLWRVIINGYPYKTMEELGVADIDEAYTATTHAIYCYIKNIGTEAYEGVGAAGNRIVNAMNLILTNARNSTETFQNPNIDIIPNTEWQIDSKEKEFISKEYEINTNKNINKFSVEIENYPEGCKVTNLENQEKCEFKSKEKFKILIPITSLENDGQFKIKIKTQMETKPIFFGKAPSAENQNYALTASPYEDVDADLLQNYEKNKAKIIIEKQDSETGEMLQGVQFELLDEEKQLIGNAETNEEGQIIFEDMIPGKYFIREVKAKDGYELNLELIQIDIELNEEKKIEITNNKIIIPKDPPIQELPVIEVPTLPVTGM